MFSKGDVIKSKHSKHTTWRVLAVCFNGTLLARRMRADKEYREHYEPRLPTRVLTRPEHYHRVGAC